MLNEREREVIECLLHGWTLGEMPLYGGLCYQDVYDLMDKLGVDKSEAVKALDDFVQEAKLVQEEISQQQDNRP